MKSLIDSILDKAVQQFIADHESDDVHSLLLKQKTFRGVPMEWIVHQITGRKKSRSKFSGLYETQGIIYPPAVNLEQSSSESTARFKSKWLQETVFLAKVPSVAADLTGGFGIDSYYLSKEVRRLACVETDQALCDIAAHNHRLLGASNISYYAEAAESFISRTAEEFDFIYIDPSRRKAGARTYRLADNVPDIARLLPQLLMKSRHVLIKTSPLLDLQQGTAALQKVRHIIVVAVDNECRELLFHSERDFADAPSLMAVDLDKNGEIKYAFSFTTDEEKLAPVEFSMPLAYLYEPGAAILKAGAFRLVSPRYGLKKLAPSTHFYTSDSLVNEFPGRIFRIREFVKPDKKLRDRFEKGFANIIIRNHPLSPEEVRKNTGLKEGGDQYLIGTSAVDEKMFMLAERLK